MPQISFLFNGTALEPSTITETHPFGPGLDAFNTSLGLSVSAPESTQVLAITRGRLFKADDKLLLQPFLVGSNPTEPDDSDLGDLLNNIFAQPFVFCYKNTVVREELLRSHIERAAYLRHVEIDEVWDEISSRFENGDESIGVLPGEFIATLAGSTLEFEIFYIPNGIMEVMYGRQSGLDLIRHHFTNSATRRMDPLFFFMSIPDADRLNYTKVSETVEHPVFTRFTKRVLLEIRDEYDKYFIGNYTIREELKLFTADQHGTISLADFAPGTTPTPIDYGFGNHRDPHVFSRLPSGNSFSRTVSRRNITAPSHHATQRIYVHTSEDAGHSNWFVENTLSWYTENNHVEYLIDGRATFRRMVEELKKIDSADHYVRLTGWFFQVDFELDSGLTLETIFNRINGVGAKINVLVWQNSTEYGDVASGGPFIIHNRHSVEFVNNLTNGRGILDNSNLDIHGSQHQKILIIKNNEGLVGFCGGVDINPDRLDDQHHKPRTDGKTLFHDTHVICKGKAVQELERTLVHRWNAHYERFLDVLSHSPDLRPDPVTRRIMRRETHTGGFTAPFYVASHGTYYNYDPGPRISVSATEEYLRNNDHGASAFIQVTRTFPQRQPRELPLYQPYALYPFQPDGDVGTLNALKRAISRARKYIYIEDQYVYPYAGDMPEGAFEITDTLAAATIAHDRNGVGVLECLYNQLENYPDLVLVLVTSGPLQYDQRLGKGRTMERMTFFVRMLRHARRHRSGHDKIVFCFPFRTSHDNQIYVHSKVFIIDDIYVKIGSANLGRRSLTHDSEADLHIIDGALQNGRRKFATEFRKKLWAEHLGIPNIECLDDVDYSLSLWLDLAGLSVANVSPYSAYTIAARTLAWEHIDPEGREAPPTNPRITPPDPSYD